MLIQTVTEDMFFEAFKRAGRENCFSYEAVRAIFADFDEYDEQVEFDVVAIACDYDEYADIDEFLAVYSVGDIYDKLKNHKDLTKEQILEATSDYTYVIDIPDSDGFVVAVF